MQEFFIHVKEGLSKLPKKIPSQYFYDTKGDELFQQIMQLDEYYLSRCEMQIIQQQSKQIAKDISAKHSSLQIVELGAGDGSKTKHMLRQFAPYFKPMEYAAMDISSNILTINKSEITGEIDNLSHTNINGNYFETYKNLPLTDHSRLVLFLGANICNYTIQEAIDFFNLIKSNLTENDYFLVAFDLVKHPRKILAAYDDKKGITKQFNLNLLERMNRELGANFNLSNFDHFPFYNPITGITSSQIISLKEQTVLFSNGFKVTFDAYEAIHTEVSKKFFWRDIEEIANQSNMNITQKYFDKNKECAYILFQPNK